MSAEPKGHEIEDHDVERLPYGTLAAVMIGAVVFFTVAVIWARTMQNAETRERLPTGEAPVTRAGQPEIGIVDQRMFELESRAARLKTRKEEHLRSYGWVDRDAGVIHVPIERAMDDVVTELNRGGASP